MGSIRLMQRVKTELEELRASMSQTLAEKFQLEQCVRYLAVKGGFVASGQSAEGGRGRDALDILQPLSLKEPPRSSRDRPTTPQEVCSGSHPALFSAAEFARVGC